MADRGRLRKEDDRFVLVRKEDIARGVARSRDRCSLARSGARSFGIEVGNLNVGEDDPGCDGPVHAWAAWYEPDAKDPTRQRYFTANYITPSSSSLPHSLALSVIRANDTGSKKLLKQWPERGILFRFTEIRSRLKYEPRPNRPNDDRKNHQSRNTAGYVPRRARSRPRTMGRYSVEGDT